MAMMNWRKAVYCVHNPSEENPITPPLTHLIWVRLAGVMIRFTANSCPCLRIQHELPNFLLAQFNTMLFIQWFSQYEICGDTVSVNKLELSLNCLLQEEEEGAATRTYILTWDRIPAWQNGKMKLLGLSLCRMLRCFPLKSSFTCRRSSETPNRWCLL